MWSGPRPAQNMRCRLLLTLLIAPALFADAPPQGSLCFPTSDDPCRIVRREVPAGANRIDLTVRTGGDGRLVLDSMPLGVYEVRRALSADAPARIAVQPGMNSVILTFARRSGSGSPNGMHFP